MIKINEEKTIYLTRGDETNELNKIPITYENYEFKKGDKLNLMVMYKNGYTKEIILNKEFIIDKDCNEFFLDLSIKDTLVFPLSNKKNIYWYDLILNKNTTIIGFDETNAKKIIVYPGGNNE